ncbi:MAG: hypothetical protein WAQ33_08685 [Gaiellaceae bacterium]
MPDEIVGALSRDYGVHPYSKWRGAHWRLASLVEIAPDDARAAAHLAWLRTREKLETRKLVQQRSAPQSSCSCTTSSNRIARVSRRILP